MIKVMSINDKQVIKEITRLNKNLDHHSKNESRRAMASVINKNLAKTRTKIIRNASKATQIPQKAIRPRVDLDRAKPNNLGAKIWIGLNKITAESAGAKPNDGGFGVGPFQWQGAFTNSKLKGIYQRKGTARLPLVSAGFGEAFTSRELKKAANFAVSKNLDVDFPAELLRELLFRLDRIIKRG
jgi:hypothetical protein